MKRLALFLYLCLIPLMFPLVGMEGIKMTLRTVARDQPAGRRCWGVRNRLHA